MYRYTYGRSASRSHHSSLRYSEGRYDRYLYRYPWYTYGRYRPRATDRDREIVGTIEYGNGCHTSNRTTGDIEENKPEVPVQELERKLHVKGVNLHIGDNAKAHHTDRYECNEDRTRHGKKMKAELVIRRGQEFKMTIKFDRPYDIARNDITLSFNMGDDYKPNKSLNATFKVNEKEKDARYKPNKWGARVMDKNENALTLSVFVPASTPIGEWEFSIRTIVDVIDGNDLIWQYNHNEDINIIFNPWCEEDWVYMEDNKWRKEAVLNDSGVQYRGNWDRIGAKTWTFGQFDDGMLDAAFHLLRKSFGFRAAPGMGNAAKVARRISKLVNSQDENGVLCGNWTGKYEGGIPPGKWHSSVKILTQYMDSGKPVKYGQCWVFSAVTTTVCRALGLPCRSVTNYSSAHNTDRDSLSIDVWKVRDDNGDWMLVKNDSVWNFHVWNEVWMARPDLSEERKWDGWQVIDATPQETSDEVYCCGPAPVKAIKEGEINVGKDGDFIFPEVNADKVHWKEDPVTGKMFQTKRKRHLIGKHISTHAPTGGVYKGSSLGKATSNNMERLDLTGDYKYKERSDRERQVTRKAERMFKLINCGDSLGTDNDEEEETDEPLEIQIEDPGDVFVGSAFDFVVNVRNVTSSTVVVEDVCLKVFYKTYFDSYTGLTTVKKAKNIELESGKVATFKVTMEEKLTLARPQDNYIFELVATASLCDSDDCVTEDFTFRLRRPDIEVKAPESCGLFDNVKVEAVFTNPLSVALTDCEIDLDGPFSWIEPRRDNLKIPDIEPGKTWRETLTIRPKPFPRDQRDRELTIGFDSRQLKEIIGYHAIKIKN